MIKIVNWNIRHGRGLDNIVDIRRIGEKLKSLNADIYTLQEIDRGAERSGYEDQAEILSEILGCEFHFTHISRVPEGTYGLATFSVAFITSAAVGFPFLPFVSASIMA